jgi:hypothetical protein
MIVVKKPAGAPAGGWPVGWATNDVHVCKPNDSSTWQLLADVPPPPPGKKLYKCKGCKNTMVR